MSLPFGARLGLSSTGPLVKTCIWRDPMSWIAIWNRPPSRRTNANALPSGVGRGDTLYEPSNVRRSTEPLPRLRRYTCGVPPRSDVNKSDPPSAVNAASVSIAFDVITRCAFVPSAPMTYTCEPPSLVSVTARRRPSGDHAGALLLPRKLATAWREPLARFCTYTTGFFCSNETYAMRVPSGDQRGDRSGSLLVTITCGSAPSASATSNWKRGPALVM